MSGGGGSQGTHSLAFRVMRLCKPSFQVADQQQPPLRLLNPISDLLIGEDYFSLNNNNGEDSISIPSNSDLDLLHSLVTDTKSDSSADSYGEISFWRRFQYEDPSDAMGISGLLVLPQSFGAIYLGETFSSYISVNNSSLFEAREVIIKAEIQTERQRVVLLDTSKSPVESIRSGGHYDFIVEHDVKELGPHTLVCAATYSDGDGERKYLPQFFKFVVANPLSVRTKVRVVKEDTFLEACLENHTKSNLYMDQVEFEPSTCWKATIIEQCQHVSENSLEHSEVYKIPILIKAGGIRNYLYQLKISSEEVARGKVDGANLLGKLQITWRTNLGEPGRLQTQEIVTNPIEHKEVDLRLLELPSSVVSGRPFSVLLRLTNYSERKVGPFEVRLSHDGLAEKVIMINGIWTLVLPEVESLKSTEFNMELIANKPGVQKISGITVSDARERKTYDSLPAMEIFVASG